MTKVSVIIPVYNEEDYLAECLDSVCRQTLKEIEIICVDDGSTDTSLDILREYEESDSRIKVFTQNNCFAGAARNRGMKIAVGKYLSFLDADDYYEVDMIEKMYARAEENKADIVICRYAEQTCNTVRKGESADNGKIQQLDWSFENLFFKQKDVFSGNELNCAGIFQITKGWAWDKLFRSDFVRRCGYEFPDFRSSEDGFFVYMLLARAEKISYMDDVFAIHRVNNYRSLSNTKENVWENGFRMWQMIKTELEQHKLYSVYKQSFLNEFVYFMLWYLDSMKTEEASRKCYEYIKSNVEREYGILSYGIDRFFNEEVFDWYRGIVED